MAPLLRLPAMITAPRHVVAVDDLPSIITAEYDEQPGLGLTFPEVQQMWHLSIRDCQDLLDYLTDTGILVHDEDHHYRRPPTCA
jgi:hypothetical protein